MEEILAEKFTTTHNERLRTEFDKLSENDDEEEGITRKDFDHVVLRMRKSKTTDNIPAEV